MVTQLVWQGAAGHRIMEPSSGLDLPVLLSCGNCGEGPAMVGDCQEAVEHGGGVRRLGGAGLVMMLVAVEVDNR